MEAGTLLPLGQTPESRIAKNKLPVNYIQGWRPWHALYGVRLHLQAPHLEVPDKELSLIEKTLPDEMLVYVFARLPVTALATAQCVCRQWRAVGSSPSLWRTACTEAFHDSTPALNEELLVKLYRGCWKTMFLDRSHLRFDGLYVSRNTYIRAGAPDWNTRASETVHLVCYFRYCRFYPDGTLAYRTSPETVSRVAKSLRTPPTRQGPPIKGKGHSPVQWGRFKLDGDKVYAAIRYENSTSTEVRSIMKLRSTSRGANNRLDISSIVSYDREDGRAVPLAIEAPAEGAAGDEEGVRTKNYTRGLAPYVFVPWDQIATSILNLPVDQMDVFIAG